MKQSSYMKRIFLMGLFVTQICNTTPTLVSIGRNCEPAAYLRIYGLRFEAFPFDWIRTFNFNGLCKLIENNFNYFLDEQYLVKNGGITNTLYDINFVHDFPIIDGPTVVSVEHEYNGIVIPNYLDYLHAVQTKYNTRINRLIQRIKSGNPVYFFRTNTIPEEAQKFVNLIKLKYPESNFLLIAVHDNPDYKESWNIPHVRSFFAEERHPTGGKFFTGKEWAKIFKALKLPAQLQNAKELFIQSNEHEECCW